MRRGQIPDPKRVSATSSTTLVLVADISTLKSFNRPGKSPPHNPQHTIFHLFYYLISLPFSLVIDRLLTRHSHFSLFSMTLVSRRLANPGQIYMCGNGDCGQVRTGAQGRPSFPHPSLTPAPRTPTKTTTTTPLVSYVVERAFGRSSHFLEFLRRRQFLFVLS